MISKETIEELEKPGRGWQYILGARMRSQNEVNEEVLARAGRYRVVRPKREDERRPVTSEGQGGAGSRTAATSSAATRTRPARMPRIGRRSWPRSARSSKPARSRWSATRAIAATSARRVRITSRSTRRRSQEEARYDGKWVLRTNMDLETAEVALQYKRLWMVEAYFRSCKSLLQTRPIYHKCDETIRGHVFCSFLAMVLRQELEARLARRWSRVRVGRRDRRPGPPADWWKSSKTASGSCCAARSRAPAARSSKQRESPCRPPCNAVGPPHRRSGDRS